MTGIEPEGQIGRRNSLVTSLATECGRPGHFIFLLGSSLDEHIYDPVRNAMDRQQIR